MGFTAAKRPKKKRDGGHERERERERAIYAEYS